MLVVDPVGLDCYRSHKHIRHSNGENTPIISATVITFPLDIYKASFQNNATISLDLIGPCVALPSQVCSQNIIW